MNRAGMLSVAGVLLLSVAGSACAAGLNITFKGSLIDRVCESEQGDQPLEVTFPTRALKYFEHHSQTDTESFFIGLKNCTSATKQKTVGLTFTFPQSEDVGGITALKTSGGTGLVIVMVDGKGNPVKPGEVVNAGQIENTGNGSINRFPFGAYVMAPPGATVKTGPYSATATFTVSYQ
ncbi:type 1 fimbrial protein [Salmonella enterica]|nr:type 1 fimbrial protein [Salmonella enterica]EAV0977033.1 type 1 fimbrial protein [Salmonella enterica]EBL9938831.1 type 1 fimbrial protein [Salmonella enterica]EGI8540368.1 type 1 fimbrial protein [Salmonella enterica]EHZ1525601.1 type 1 fimbrial protein [Salmonella enterica]